MPFQLGWCFHHNVLPDPLPFLLLARISLLGPITYVSTSGHFARVIALPTFRVSMIVESKANPNASRSFHSAHQGPAHTDKSTIHHTYASTTNHMSTYPPPYATDPGYPPLSSTTATREPHHTDTYDSPMPCFWTFLSYQSLRFLHIPRVFRSELANKQLPADALLGKSLFDMLHPADGSLLKRDFKCFMDLRTLQGSIIRSVNVIDIDRSGAIPWVDRWSLNL